VHIEYIFNRSFVSVAWDTIQINLYVICNYIEIFNMGLWGTDFLRGVVYK